MSDDEIIAVVQAHKEGKKIEHLDDSYGYESWRWCNNPTWNFGTSKYRVAPEPRKPREWKMPVSMLDAADMIQGIIQKDEPSILVREVIE